jgi:hypothetical protein
MKTITRIINTSSCFRFLVVALAMLALNLRAANIVWVSDTPNTNTLGGASGFSVGPIAGTLDDGFITLLQNAGHNVQRFTSDDNTANQISALDLAALNTNDLIIIGRATGSGMTTGAQGVQWNTGITKPLMVSSPFLTRSNNFGWFTNVAPIVVNGAQMPITAASANAKAAYLFNLFGPHVVGLTTVNNYDEALAQGTSQTSDNQAFGGVVLATGQNTNKIIVEFPAGTAVRGGSLAGYRLYFAAGNREYGTAPSNTIAFAGAETLTPSGEAIFLRAVALAANGGVVPNLGEAPVITQDPASTNLCINTTLVLASAASGQNPLYYQWYSNDVAIANGTNAVYRVNSFQAGDVGNYYVVVTNSVNVVTSAVASVTAAGVGVVITQIPSVTNCPGTPVTFTANATGDGALLYTWYKGGTVVQAQSANNTYTIPSVIAGDAGAYSVGVDGSCNGATNTFSLSVVSAPTISANPVNQVTPVGNGAVFSVTASATAATPTYQWRTNGVSVTGATGSSFAISNVTFAASGMVVDVEVSTCVSTVSSTVATLTVVPQGGISFDFNQPGSFTNIYYNLVGNDWISRGALPNVVNENATAGVNGTRGLLVTGTSDTSQILQAPTFDFSLPGKTLTASVMVKIKAVTQNNRNTQLGFVTATNVFDSATGGTAQGINDVNPQGFMSVILQSTAQPAQTYQLRFQHRGTGGGIAEQTPVAAPGFVQSTNLTQGNWYKLTAVFSNASAVVANTLAFSATLQDMGPSGTTPGNVVLAYTPTNAAQATLLQQKFMYLAIRNARSDAGVDVWDNIYAHTVTGDASFKVPVASQTVLQGRRAEFRAYVEGTGLYSYQWNSNGTPIIGATSWKYVTQPTLTTDSGAIYTVTVSGATAVPITSDPATLTVTADPLAVVSAGSADGALVGVRFNQPVERTTAETAANYIINGSAATRAVLRPDGQSVVLTAPTTLSGNFTVTVANVQDLSGGTVGGANSATGYPANMASLDISTPTQNPLVMPAGTTYSFASNQFEVMAGGIDIWNTADSFRFVYTTKSGDFDLKMRAPYMDIVRTPSKAGLHARASLDPTDLMVTAAANPQWPGRQYYEGSRRDIPQASAASWGTTTRVQYPNAWLRLRRTGNTFSRYNSTNGVNWNLDGQTSLIMPNTLYVGLAVCSVANGNELKTIIDGYGDYVAPATSIAITTPLQTTVNITNAGTTNLILAATATGLPNTDLAYVWQRWSGTAWTNLLTAGVNSGTLTVGPLTPADSGAQYRCVIRLPGATDVISGTATVNVYDTTAPTFSAAALPLLSGQQIILSFSEQMGSSALNPAAYTLTNSFGQVFAISSVNFLGTDRTRVVLNTADVLPAGFYGVIGNNTITDIAGTPIAATTRVFTQIGAFGAVRHEMYSSIGGGNPNDLLGNAYYQTNSPSMITFSNGFAFNMGNNSFPDFFNNYGLKASALFIAPTQGNYKFWTRSDDGFALWMNTNGAFSVLSDSRNCPAAQRPIFAFDGVVGTKWLSFDKTNNVNIIVTPRTPTAVANIRFTTAGDVPDRDPLTFVIEGSMGSPVTGPWSFIAADSTGLSTDPGRNTAGPIIPVVNATAYTHYRITMTSLRNYAAANSMQIAEISLMDVLSNNIPVHNLSLLVQWDAYPGAVTYQTQFGTTPANAITNIALQAGKSYYIEGILKEGTGGDGFAVTWTDPAVVAAPGVTTFIPTANLMYPFTTTLEPLAAGPQQLKSIIDIYRQRPATYGTLDLNGDNIASLIFSTNTAYFVEGLPDRFVGYGTVLAFQPQLGHNIDNYLGKIVSYFVPPTTGNYKFYMASDDAGMLLMNTNAVNSTDPLGKRMLGSLPAYTGTYTLIASNVQLNAGQRYYIEGLWKEAGGGDGIRIAVRPQSDPVVPAATEYIFGNMLEFPTNLARIGVPKLVQLKPVNPVVNDGQSISFEAVGISGAYPYSFQWLKNGVQVYVGSPYNGLATYTTPPLLPSDNGAVYTLVISNLLGRSEFTSTVTVNSLAPNIVSVAGSQNGQLVTITFNKAVDPVSAIAAGNYSISGVTIYGATLDASGTKVTLYVSPLTPSTSYTVNVNGVNDLAGNTINASKAFLSFGIGGSAVLVEVFTNIPGTLVSNLVSSPKYLANAPDVSGFVDKFGFDTRIGQLPAASLNGWGPFPGNGVEFYGARLSAYFIAPSNGNYRFYISSDDFSELWMNTNGMDPNGKVLIAQLNVACCKNYNDATGGNNNSALQVGNISLTGGQAYYMEALFKEGGGGDYFRLAFREAGDANPPPDTEIASAAFFTAPGDPNVNSLNIVSSPPTDVTVYENDPVSLTLVATTVPADNIRFASYRWQRFDGVAYTNIPGATSSNLSFNARLGDNGAQFRLTVSLPGSLLTFDTTLHVNVDNVPPQIEFAGSLDGKQLIVRYARPVNRDDATLPLLYDLDGQFFETTPENGGAGYLLADNKTVIFNLASSSDLHVISGSPFNVNVIDVRSAAASPVTGSSTYTGAVIEDLTSGEIGTPTGNVAGGYNPAVIGLAAYDANGAPFTYSNSAVVVTNGGFTVKANGYDIWNNADGFHYLSRQVAGDFDVKVRVESFNGADTWSKAGWMIRTGLTNSSRNVFFGLTPSSSPIAIQNPAVNNHTFQWRDLDGGASANSTPAGNPPSYPNAWLRFKRTGSIIQAFLGNDGVNWTLHSTRDTAANPGGAYPAQVYLGLASTSHDQTRALANNAIVDYRNIYFPVAPTITTQPTPADSVVPIHSTVTFSGVIASGFGPFTYQWVKDGNIIPGQSSATLVLNNVNVTDSGVYNVIVGNDGGGTLSSNLTLVVSNALPQIVNDSINVNENTLTNINPSLLLGNDTDPEGDALTIIGVSGVAPATYSANFDAGLSGAALYGATTYNATPNNRPAFIVPSGGPDGSAYLRFNDGLTYESGTMVVNELTPGKRVGAFTASFKFRISDVSAEPADGFSFNFAPDLIDTWSGGAEGGIGTGFSFCLKNYRFTGAANTSGMRIRYNGADVITQQTPTWNSTRWVPVTITVTAGGLATVSVDGTNVFANVALPGYTPKTGRFGIYARSGGAFESHSMDDLSIYAITADTARTPFTDATSYGNAYLTSTGGVANSGVLHLTDAVNNQLGAFVMNDILGGNAMTAFDASFMMKIQAGTAPGADGFSFNFANDLPNAGVVGAESGVGSGLSVGLRNYPPGSESVVVKFGGATLATVPVSVWNSPNFFPVTLNLAADGKLTVTINGTNVVSGLATGYIPTVGRFGLYARCGGLNQTHWVDDLSINANSATGSAYVAKNFDNVGGPGTVTLSGGTVNYHPDGNACGSDSFYYIAADGQQGGTALGIVNVTIVPTNNITPTISSCPANRTIALGANCTFVVPELRGSLLANGNCITVDQSPVPGTVLAPGTHTVTFTVTDSQLAQSTCQMSLTGADLTAPAMTCPADITLEATSPSGAAATFSSSATDNCDVNPTVSYSAASGSTFPLGTNIVTVTAYDTALNTNTCTFRVIVRDTTAPLIVCPADQVLTCTSTNGMQAFYTVGATDIADASPVVVVTPASGSFFSLGTNIVSATATDASGNQSGCTFKVVVLEPLLSLTVSKSDTNVVITWPQSCLSHELQQSDNLSSPSNWGPCSATIEVVGSLYRATIPADQAARFYQLKKP